MSLHHADLLVPLGLVVALRFIFGAGPSNIRKVLVLRCSIWIYQTGLIPTSQKAYIVYLSCLLGFLFAIFFQFVKDDQAFEHFERSHHLRPLIFPARTTHTRIFPKKHGFSYSYLLVGIPVGWKGSIASMVSADVDTLEDLQASDSWFSVNAEDHLNRGRNKAGLIGKLRMYLESQGESIDEYPNAYLVTAPRFFGYVFNPVSFWYLFSKDMLLKAMILEVNNTFDERRMYFMKRGMSVDLENPLDKADQKFAASWEKDFHVSPFNSRKGGYALIATNPFAGSSVHIDNNITLKSSKDHPKIVARVFSTGPAINPLQMTAWAKLRFILSWFWVGFVTFPRIVKEAAKLFFKRKLHIWYRPEIMQTSVGRRPTQRESTIDRCFQAFFASERGLSPHRSSASSGLYEPVGEHLGFKTLTPQFYTDVVLADNPASYVLESSKLPADKRTFYTSDADKTNTLAHLLAEPKNSQTQKIGETNNGLLYFLRWQTIVLLRYSRAHPLDSFVRNHLSPDLSEPYRKAVTSLLLSQYICFGVVEILDLVWAVLNIWLAWKGMGSLLNDIRAVETGKVPYTWTMSWALDGYVVW